MYNLTICKTKREPHSSDWSAARLPIDVKIFLTLQLNKKTVKKRPKLRSSPKSATEKIRYKYSIIHEHAKILNAYL